MHFKISVGYIAIVFSIMIFTIMIFSCVNVVKANEMDIIITNINGNEEITEINEDNYFKISILDSELEGSPFLYDVFINFNQQDYYIDESGELNLQAPSVFENTILTINASKESYNTTSKDLIILNFPQLKIIPLDGIIVDAGLKFSVKIEDDQGIAITNAYVAVDYFGEKVLSKENGIAVLKAPENQEKINVTAQKEGYKSGNITLDVNIIPPWWNSLIGNPNFIIAIAIIILIIIVVFVHFRQKKSIYSRAKEIVSDKMVEKYSKDKGSSDNTDEVITKNQYYERDAIRTYNTNDSKVEEIRISRPNIEKKVIPVSEKDSDENIRNNIENDKEKEDKWFEGDNDLKYEVDKLTGEVDDEQLDKWFEGVDELKEKIHKKMKEKSKKLKEEK